jgi:hypothetical protein
VKYNICLRARQIKNISRVPITRVKEPFKLIYIDIVSGRNSLVSLINKKL